MRATDDARLIAEARRAYERGRVRAGLHLAVWTLPVTMLSLLVCRQPVLCLGCGAILAALVAAFVWRGQEWAKGVRPGLLAGSVPLLVPMVVRLSGHACGDFCLLAPTACAIAGITGGFVLFRLAPVRPGLHFALSALAVAGLVGFLGCLLAGSVGVLSMAVAMTSVAAPLLRVSRS